MAGMDRIVPYVVVPLVAAAASLLNLVHFGLVNMFRPAWPLAVTLAWYAAFVLIVAGVVVAFREVEKGRRGVLIAALAVVLAAGFLPRVMMLLAAPPLETVAVEPAAEPEVADAPDPESGPDAEPDAGAQPDVATPALPSVFPPSDWAADIAARAESNQPYDAEQGLAFLDHAAGLDLDNAAIDAHTAETFPLVEEALAANVLDPDALTTGAAVADSAAATLTVLWYDRRIRPGSPTAIDRNAWALLQMLVASGADIAGDDAAELRADLAKIVEPGEGRFIALSWGEPPNGAPEPEQETGIQ